MNNPEFLKNQKNDVLDLEKWAAYKANYKQAHDHDKNYTSITKQIDNFISSCASKKITNQDLNQLKTFCEYLLKDNTNLDIIMAMSDLDFKKSLVFVYDKCQKVGVVKTSNDTSITRKVGLVHKKGESVLKDMLVLLFSVTLTEQKTPKKEKTKKTIKK